MSPRFFKGDFDPFDLLPAAEKQIVICELLQRVRDFDLPPLADEESTMCSLCATSDLYSSIRVQGFNTVDL